MQQKWNSLDEGRHLTLNLLSKEIELRNGEVGTLTLSASFSHLYNERVVRDVSFHLSVGACMKAN